jgi:acyl carrier protein
VEEARLEYALRVIVRKNSPLKPDSVSDDQLLTSDLGFDSMAFLTTISDVEDQLGVSIPLENLEELRHLRFKDMVGLVVRHAGGHGAEDAD